MAKSITKSFALHLLLIYFQRIERGDGIDLEIKWRDDTEESDLVAIRRIMQHFRDDYEKGMREMLETLASQTEVITKTWQHLWRNVTGKIYIQAKEEKGYTHLLTREEVEEYREKYQELFLTDSMVLWGEEISIQILNELNPAGMPFLELQKIVRRGLDVVCTVSAKDLQRFIQDIFKGIPPSQELVLQINGNEMEFSIKLPDKNLEPLTEIAKDSLNHPDIQRMTSPVHFRAIAITQTKAIARAREKLTKEDLAARLRISRQTLYNFFNDDPSLWDHLKEVYNQTLISLIEDNQ